MSSKRHRMSFKTTSRVDSTTYLKVRSMQSLSYERQKQLNPYDGNLIPGKRRSPVSLPSNSPVPAESAVQRSRSQPTAEISSPEPKSLIPPPPQYLPSDPLQRSSLTNGTSGHNEGSFSVLSLPPEEFRLFHASYPSPIPPPPALSPPATEAFLPVIPPPPMRQLISLQKNNSDSEVDHLKKCPHLPIRPPPTHPQSKVTIKPKPKIVKESRIEVSRDNFVCSNGKKVLRDQCELQVHCIDQDDCSKSDSNDLEKESDRLKRLLLIAASSQVKGTSSNGDDSEVEIVAFFPPKARTYSDDKPNEQTIDDPNKLKTVSENCLQASQPPSSSPRIGTEAGVMPMFIRRDESPTTPNDKKNQNSKNGVCQKSQNEELIFVEQSNLEKSIDLAKESEEVRKPKGTINHQEDGEKEKRVLSAKFDAHNEPLRSNIDDRNVPSKEAPLMKPQASNTPRQLDQTVTEAIKKLDIKVSECKKDKRDSLSVKNCEVDGRQELTRHITQTTQRVHCKVTSSSRRSPEQHPVSNKTASKQAAKSGEVSLAKDISKKQKCLEEIQKKFGWFQWNQFYVANDNNAINLSRKRKRSQEKAANNEKRFRELSISGPVGRSRNPDSSSSDESSEAGKSLESLRPASGQNICPGSEDGRNHSTEIGQTVQSDSGWSEGEEGSVTENPKLSEPVLPAVEKPKEDDHGGVQKSFVWKKRLLIGYQQETKTFEAEMMKTLGSGSGNQDHPDVDDGKEVEIICEQKGHKGRNMQLELRIPETVPPICKDTFVSLADLPNQLTEQSLISRPELKLIPLPPDEPAKNVKSPELELIPLPPDRPVNNASRPELKLIPLPSDRPANHVCKHKAAFSITQMAANQSNRLISTCGKVFEVTNIQKFAMNPSQNFYEAHARFFPPALLPQRFPPVFNNRTTMPPFPMPMAMPLPRLERLPKLHRQQYFLHQQQQQPPHLHQHQVPHHHHHHVRQQQQHQQQEPQHQLQPFQVQAWMPPQGGQQAQVAAPMTMPMPEKRDGSYYRSAKQFILPDDTNNSFRLTAH